MAAFRRNRDHRPQRGIPNPTRPASLQIHWRRHEPVVHQAAARWRTLYTVGLDTEKLSVEELQIQAMHFGRTDPKRAEVFDS